MSINVQEAIKAIRDMRPIIDPEEDYLTIVGAEESIATSEAKRKKELEEAHAVLKALSRTLESARVSAARPPSVPSVEAHATLLNDFDSSKLSLMKAISDAEGIITNKEAELARLRDEARRLEEYDSALEHEKELDSSTLRLQLYKGLGFEPVADTNGTVTKILVRARSGDLHSVELKNTGRDITEHLWHVVTS